MLAEATLHKLYRYGYSLTNNESSAYDLLQDALERFLKHSQTHSTVETPEFYIRRIMRNGFIDKLRREKRYPLETLSGADEHIADSDLQDLESLVTDQQTVNLIWETLNPLERELLHLWAVEEFTAREIAEQLEAPRGTILSRIHRLRRKIREQLGEDQPGASEGKLS